MVRPLTKRKVNGQLYTRPREIEAAIAAALLLDRGTLLRRAPIPDQRDPEFLPPECLVHLIRRALEQEDEELSHPLLNALFARCSAMLGATISPARSQRAADLRQDVMDRLVDKFVDDVPPDALDIFEVRFARAFRMLRIDALRSNKPEADKVSVEADQSAEEVPSQAATPDTILSNKELAQAAWRLPPHLSRAVVLVHLMDYEIESTDPQKTTAATTCKVSGRTIRARLAEGMSLLRKFMEK